jgi:hypothetical protein
MDIRNWLSAACAISLLMLLQGCGGTNAAAPTTLDAPAGYAVKVQSTYPANGKVVGSSHVKISVTFNETMDPSSLSPETFKLLQDGSTPVSGKVTGSGRTVIFEPSAPLQADTVYTAIATTGMRCQEHDAYMANDYSWSFATKADMDHTPPSVSTTAFAVADLGGGTYGGVVVAFFSEAMDPTSINTGTFRVKAPGGEPVPGSVQYIGLAALFTPAAMLQPNTDYVATITTGAKDMEGEGMAHDRSWGFTTPAISVFTGVHTLVTATAPADGAIDVLLGSEVNITFNQTMDPTTITPDTIILRAPGEMPVAGNLSYTGVTATFIPAYPLAPDTTYEVDVTTAVKSLAGVPMDGLYDYVFTTGEDTAGTPPVVQYTSPTPGELGVNLNRSVLAAFDEPMDPVSISTGTFTVTNEDGTPVGGMVSYTGLAAVFTPDTALLPGVTYTARISTGATDANAERMASDYVWQFSTGDQFADSVPQVLFTNPGADQTRVGYIYPEVQIAFNEVMDPRTINADNIVMMDQNGAVIPGTFNYLAYVVIFTPSQPLDQFSLYTVTVTTGVRDMEGVPLAEDYSWWFSTTGAM